MHYWFMLSHTQGSIAHTVWLTGTLERGAGKKTLRWWRPVALCCRHWLTKSHPSQCVCFTSISQGPKGEEMTDTVLSRQCAPDMPLWGFSYNPLNSTNVSCKNWIEAIQTVLRQFKSHPFVWTVFAEDQKWVWRILSSPGLHEKCRWLYQQSLQSIKHLPGTIDTLSERLCVLQL